MSDSIIITIIVILIIMIFMYLFGFIKTLLYAFGAVVVFNMFSSVINRDK